MGRDWAWGRHAMPVGRGLDHPGHCPKPLPTTADGLASATGTSESPAWRDQAVGHRATPGQSVSFIAQG